MLQVIAAPLFTRPLLGHVVDLADFTFYFTSVLMLDANPDAIEKENWNWQKKFHKSIDISTLH